MSCPFLFVSQVWQRIKQALLSGALGAQVRLMKTLQEVRVPCSASVVPCLSLVCYDVVQRKRHAEAAIARGDVVTDVTDLGDQVDVTHQGNAALYSDVR